jgi:hypothetical protein
MNDFDQTPRLQQAQTFAHGASADTQVSRQFFNRGQLVTRFKVTFLDRFRQLSRNLIGKATAENAVGHKSPLIR